MASVTSLTLTDSGQRYTSVPTVTVAVPDADSTTATGTASIDSNGGVNTVAVAEIGNYYTTAPLITFSSPTTDSANATATATIDSDVVNSLSITDSGLYYTTAPTVSFSAPDKDSAVATATSNISGGLVTSIDITSRGRYYTQRPTVTIGKPVDSDVFVKFDTITKKFGSASLLHDSNDTTTLVSLNSSYKFNEFYGESANTVNETSFWLYFDSIHSGNILFTNDYKIFIDDSGYVGMTFNLFNRNAFIDSANTLSNSITKYNTTTPIALNTWTFVQAQTFHEQDLNLSTKLRLSVNGTYDSTYDVTSRVLDEDANYNYYDSGEFMIIGKDVNQVAPTQLKRDGSLFTGDAYRSFSGYIDNLTFTSVSGVTSFDSDSSQSTRIPDSANDYYYNTSPIIQSSMDVTQAFGLAYFESGGVTRVLVTESGGGYTSAPSVLFDSPTGPAADFKATATATVTNGKISGLSVTYPGKFYLTAPTVTIDSATGTAADFRAQATATVSNGSIVSMTLTDSGSYYLIAPDIIIEGPTGTAADFRATGRVFLDSDTKKIRRISLTDGGRFYETAPAVTIAGGDSTADFAIGETVNQTLSTGVVMSGEVAKWSDSDNKLYVIHAGADDGNYHNFVTGLPIVGANTGANGNVLSVSEDNKISENEQNEEFSPSTSNELDFLDFTETNPFGDPENN